MSFVVAIDGPAGSGKGSITKIIAKKMKLSSIDTGAMYRCVTLYTLRKGIDPKDSEGIIKVLEDSLKQDRSKTQIIGFSKLNLLEMTRKHMKGGE